MKMFFLIISLVFLLFFLLRFIYYFQLKTEFKRKYEVDYFPKRVKIHRSKHLESGNYYTLNFPFWIYANKDGSRDKRRKNNGINYPGCDLYMDQFHVEIKNPMLMVQYVNFLRKNNVNIEKNKFEEIKTKKIINEKEKDREMDDLNNLINRFKNNPYEFEGYCARLYQLMGVDAENTPSSNDGGYDIILHYKNGHKGLVECKCYNGNKIGRPLIQKLVGANQIVGAQHLVYITTSDYSEAAKKYAAETGVELIDSVRLMDMIYSYTKSEKAEIKINKDEWLLCKDDLKRYMPEDIFVTLM